MQPHPSPPKRVKTGSIVAKNKARVLLSLSCWSLVIIGLALFSYFRLSHFTQAIAIAEARGYILKDKTIRHWSASHGGVYVPTDKRTPPNPYLSHLSSRDITTPEGTALTLMNPAYMIRQIYEYQAAQYDILGHITSLKLLRPENKPDEWERNALEEFEKGSREMLEFTRINNIPHLKFMQPLFIKQGCLKCHSQQGYKEGDVRGGISITIPLTALLQKQRSSLIQQFTLLAGLWILGTFFIFFQEKRVVRCQAASHSAIKLLTRERDRFMHGPVMTFTWKNSDNWPVEQVSENVIDILGYYSTDSLYDSVPYASLIHPDDLQQVMNEVTENSTPDTTGFTHKPYRLRHRNGSIVWVLDNTTLIRNDQGDITHYQGYLVDISETMLMKEEIIETKNRLASTLEEHEAITATISDALFVFDEQGRFKWWNRSMETITGMTAQQIQNANALDFFIRDDKEKMQQAIKKAFSDGLTTIEARLRTTSGTQYYQMCGTSLKLNGKRYLVGSAHDLTSQKRVEQELTAAKEAAESASRAKSIFLSSMSHELRTPLNAILGYTQILAGDKNLSTQQQSGIKTMYQSGQHLLMLINDILDLSKIEAGKMELQISELRFPEFLQGIIDIIRVRSDAKGLELRYSPTEPLPVIIKTDELRLRQIILNLLSNAVKFTDHGYIALLVQCHVTDGNKTLLTITIEDSGPGIAAEMQEKIFAPFQQTGERLKYSEGSGLGLSISRTIVQLMGGKLQVTSPISKEETDTGQGSRFFFSVEVAVLDTPSSINARTEAHFAGDTTQEMFDSKTITVPSQEILKRLIGLIQGGDIDAITAQAEKLTDMNSGKYQVFAEHIKQLADDFHLTGLEKFIDAFLTKQDR